LQPLVLHTFLVAGRCDGWLFLYDLYYDAQIMSLPFSTYHLLNPRPQHTAKGRQCAETGLQVVKLVTKQNAFHLYRPPTELGKVAENINTLPKCFIDVAKFFLDMSQKNELLLCFSSVS
jgi:hypothetical protein